MWLKSVFVLIAVTLVLQVRCFDNSTITSEVDNYLNLTNGNPLWTSLIKNCLKDPTMDCIEKNVFHYLDDTFDSKDLEFTSFLKFTKNSINYKRIDNTSISEDVEDISYERSPLEEISRSLHDKSVKFLMTHDMEVQLPETVFQGALLKISPRDLQEDGTFVKFQILPKDVSEVSEGRLFKKLKKFISERLIWALMAILLVIKLLAAKFMFLMPAVVGAVTAKKLLIKVLLFVFPFLHHLFKWCAYAPHGTKFHHHHHKIQHVHHIGHGSHHGPPPHIEHHGHHHPHSVEIISPHAEGPPDYHGGLHGGPPDYQKGGLHGDVHEGPHWHAPSIHHNIDIEPPHKPLYNPHEQELEYFSGGPALSHHFINHRQDASGSDDNEVKPWGQGQSKNKNRPLAPTEIENMILKAEKEALIKDRLQEEKLRIQQENARLQEQLKQAMKLQGKLRQQADIVKNRVTQVAPALSPFLKTPPAKNSNLGQATYLSQSQQYQQQQVLKQRQELELKQQKEQFIKQELLKKQAQEQQQQQQQLQQQQQQQQQLQQHQQQLQQKQQKPPIVAQQSAFEKALHQAATITYDSFYSPILEKIDKILSGLGFSDEPCRERLICSMYKNPTKFSPHSNLLSAELSRDSTELQKPKTTNAAVIRFYRYVQAARDGQDKRECLRLYPACSINTEQ